MSWVPVIDPEKVREIVEPVRFVDARAGRKGRAHYLECHLADAEHVDLDTELSGDRSNPEEGGRHPLPSPAKFARVLKRMGIHPSETVVVYDDDGGAHAAARFWWMLRALGHERVAILNGGFDAAVAAGWETHRGAPSPRSGATYVAPAEWALPTADFEFVRAHRERDDWRLLDVRAPARYRGDHEPFDPVAGHIPGAINTPFKSNLDERGRFRDPASLREEYRRVLPEGRPDRVVVSCGSGVTACHTLAALEHAGWTGAKLYVGSFSEWCRSGEPCSKGDMP